MKFATELKRLSSAATAGKWAVDPDDRPDMEWNNHIVQVGSPTTICFMTHEPLDNSPQQAAAELIVYLRNHADAIAKLVEAAEAVSRDNVTWQERNDLDAALSALNKED
jgi:hypothetical protein